MGATIFSRLNSQISSQLKIVFLLAVFLTDHRIEIQIDSIPYVQSLYSSIFILSIKDIIVFS
jgi:hypothetical protein